MNKVFITKSAKETQKIGKSLAKEILILIKKGPKVDKKEKAVILEMYGDLGSGKTTFLQGFAKGLGVKERVLSPTFVIMRRFNAVSDTIFYHLDCYRLEGVKNIAVLGIKDLIYNSNNIIAIEWAEKIKRALPKNTIKLNFTFINQNTRKIILKIPYTIHI